MVDANCYCLSKDQIEDLYQAGETWRPALSRAKEYINYKSQKWRRIMMKIKRAVLMAVLVVAVAALAVPLVGFNARAAGSAADSKALLASKSKAAAAIKATASQQNVAVADSPVQQESAISGEISAETRNALGVVRSTDRNASARIAQALKNRKGKGGDFTTQSGEPNILDARSALSTALLTNIGGRDNQFSEVALIADWDGREDCAADREQKVDDFSFSESEIDITLTRTAISEHTVANGFNNNVYYYGDSVGNLWIGTDSNPGQPSPTGTGVGGVPTGTGVQVDAVTQVNIVALVNTGASGGVTLISPGGAPVGGTVASGDCLDDQVAVTGIAVNPVADLGDFGAGLCGVVGEVVYVSVLDTEGCARNATGTPLRTRIFVFGFTDTAAGVASVGAIQILRSKFSNIAGVAVDDDGSLYYQLLDLIQFTGGAIFKATEICRTVAGCPSPRINRVIGGIPDPPTLDSWATNGIPPAGAVTNAFARHTNYGRGSGRNAAGTLISGVFANIVSLATGPCNVLYAAVSRSLDVSDPTTSLFPGGTAFPAGTPSMVICFADCSGALDACTSPAPGLPGALPAADGFADVSVPGATLVAGFNNFRVFVLGNGTDIRTTGLPPGLLIDAPLTVLKLDMQIDYTLHSGLAVSEEGGVYVISGGTPAGIGKNPSPMLGEVLWFVDNCPVDCRADFVDLRGDILPNPPASGGNVGDGDSDRFDHIYWQAPLDQVTITPGGLAGLARGFLRYTNRLAINPIGGTVVGGVLTAPSPLGVTQPVLGDDDTTGPVIFEFLDPGHQAAGGDDQNVPNRGDDSDTVPNPAAGVPATVGSPAPIPPVPNSSAPGTERNGGFEFVFGGPGVNCVWNGFFWNSNGNITFGGGDTSNTPTVPGFRTGLPRIAPAWADLNPAARAVNLCTFPVMALGFSEINAFKIRWINVPEFGSEGCTTNASNTFSVTLYDDGTGIDENTNETLSPVSTIGNNLNDGAAVFDKQEGPTDLRFSRENRTGLLVGAPPRPEGSGIFVFCFCRMDLLGTELSPVITGFSIGGLSPLNPPGLCETNLSEAARAADTNPFGVLVGNQTANICTNCCIGEGTEPTIFELFNEGRGPRIGAGGEITFASPDFDLRFGGHDAALCTPPRQRDLNKGKVCFFGVGCAPPTPPTCVTVVPGTFVTNPGTTGLVNALCAVQLNLVGFGFFPNEVTTICSGFSSETGVPLQRPGKTVTTAATLACDTNGDAIPDVTIPLATVTPVSCNLVQGTATVSSTFGTTSASAFPAACCGGPATITITTTFSAGDNNVFGPFTRTSTCALNLGTRAPVVFSVTPSSGNCAVGQDLLISGACFSFTQFVAGGPNVIGNVTSVFAVDITNPGGARIPATAFVVLNPNLIDAFFNFGSANAGRRFLIFVCGPGGCSRDLTTLPAGSPAGCALGNEQGITVTFTCNAATTTPLDCERNPNQAGCPPVSPLAVVNGCKLNRDPSGTFTLDVLGANIKRQATATISGLSPRKIKFRDLETGKTDSFTRITLKGKVCRGIPGNIVVTNPNSAGSTPFFCNERCPVN
jgi:hypothetical protein